eukprot:CCRYP_015508-RA/>CCRYP_015508-RA protein AED:0.06 eAED:0.06 QI:133/1/1/1/1/1/6/1103/1440
MSSSSQDDTTTTMTNTALDNTTTNTNTAANTNTNDNNTHRMPSFSPPERPHHSIATERRASPRHTTDNVIVPAAAFHLHVASTTENCRGGAVVHDDSIGESSLANLAAATATDDVSNRTAVTTAAVGTTTSIAAATKHNTTTNGMQRTKRQIKPPQKFIARPSKQGWSVEEGDAAFLNMFTATTNSHSRNKKNKAKIDNGASCCSKKRKRDETGNDNGNDDGGGGSKDRFGKRVRQDTNKATNSTEDNHNESNERSGNESFPQTMAMPRRFHIGSCTVNQLKSLAADDNGGAVVDDNDRVVVNGKKDENRGVASCKQSIYEKVSTATTVTTKRNRGVKPSSGAEGKVVSRKRSPSTVASRKSNQCETTASVTTGGKGKGGNVTGGGVVLRRKSAISRRPRRLQPTEKILAMQNDAVAAGAAASPTRTRSKSKTATIKSQRQFNPTPETNGNQGLWLCLSCGFDNLEMRKRCSNCQGWRGGTRRDMVKSSKEMETATKSTEHDLLPSSSPSSSSWQCTKCGNCVAANKARCGKCQGWRGGVRDNIATKQKKRKKNAVESCAKTNRDPSKVETDRKLPGGAGRESSSANVSNVAEQSEIDDGHNNLDDVACCLCKCAVDFSDAFFFLPKPTNAPSKIEVDDHSKPSAEEVASAVVSSAIVSSECSVVDAGAVGMDASPASPMTVLRGADAAILTEGILVDDTSASMDGAEKDRIPSGKVESPTPTVLKGKEPSLDDGSGNGSHDPQPPFRLPHRFHDPGNSLILCDGPEYASRRKSSSGSQYKCDRAYHQLCHFIPVFHVPRGAWRCLICRYRDDEFLRRKASKGAKRKSHDKDEKHLSDEQLSVIFRMAPETSPSSDTSSAEQLFEILSAPLKAKLLHAELTTRAKSLINTSLSNIRTAEHSIRAFTETTKARKALMERIENMGLPQELIQCFARVAQAKMRIQDMIRGVENAIKTRQHHDPLVNANGGEQSDCIDVVGELMHWYSSQEANDPNETLFRNLFPEGKRTFARRRVEPRTDEANADADAASNSSGVSLDNLRCACCLTGNASDENDLLLCDGLGCYRAYHMCCVEPKLTPEDLAADENEHWFCPLCKAHGELIHYAQREYLGDDFFSSPPPKEWEKASDVFPDAHFETVVAQKLKEGIRGDEVNEFLTEALGISFSLPAQQTNMTATLEYEDEEDESDDDFDFGCQEEEDADSSSNEDSDDEEKQLMEEKIDKDELDALSMCSSALELNDDVMSGSSSGNTRGRRSTRKRNLLRHSNVDSNSDEEQSGGTSPPSDVGKLDTANIVYGKRNRTKVDYRKLNDAMFGDESDDEAQGADVKFAYKPKAKVRRDNSSSDESEVDDESSDENAKLAAYSSKAKPAKTKRKKIKNGNNKKLKSKAASGATTSGSHDNLWSCIKCGNNNLPTKKRCSNCQGWRGGVRENIRSPATKPTKT